MESLEALYTERTGDVLCRHLFVRVAKFQGERQLARVNLEEFGFVRPEQKLLLGLNDFSDFHYTSGLYDELGGYIFWRCSCHQPAVAGT